jgi:hypothetical protein
MKIRCGYKFYGEFLVPDTAVIIKNSKGQDVYISMLTMDKIVFKVIEDGSCYSMPYRQSIVNMFNS